MKKTLVFVSLLAVFSFVAVGVALAQEEAIEQTEILLDQTTVSSAVELGLEEPTLLPDSRWYFLKNWGRGLQAIFTFNKIKKAELQEKFAAEKLLETEKMIWQDKAQEKIEKAVDNYQQAIDKLNEKIDKIKENASTSQAVSDFLDKYTQQQFLHQKILEKLKEQVPEQIYQKIEEARKKHLEKFGQVMAKLEDKAQIRARLENALNNIPGDEMKDLKDILILQELREKIPENLREEIQEVKTRAIENMQNKIREREEKTEEKVDEYLNRTNEWREKVQKRIGQQCPLNMINPLSCKYGMETIIDANGCPVPRCKEKTSDEKVCYTLYDPVCGFDNKTYSNDCYAELAGVKIIHKGECQSQNKKQQGKDDDNTIWIPVSDIEVEAEPIR